MEQFTANFIAQFGAKLFASDSAHSRRPSGAPSWPNESEGRPAAGSGVRTRPLARRPSPARGPSP